MSRLSTLVSRPRRTLAALATVLVAVGITAASGADFTATSANADTTFATGTLEITNAKEAQAVWASTADMRPGDPARTGTVDITNSGSLSGVFTLQRGTVIDSDDDNPLSGKLDLVVKDCGTFDSGTPTCDAGDPVRYTGTVAAMGSAVALGTFAAGDAHRYEFSVTVNTSADNAYQGDGSVVPFSWNAA
jgi:spore coat-associated protein N